MNLFLKKNHVKSVEETSTIPLQFYFFVESFQKFQNQKKFLTPMLQRKPKTTELLI